MTSCQRKALHLVYYVGLSWAVHPSLSFGFEGGVWDLIMSACSFPVFFTYNDIIIIMILFYDIILWNLGFSQYLTDFHSKVSNFPSLIIAFPWTFISMLLHYCLFPVVALKDLPYIQLNVVYSNPQGLHYNSILWAWWWLRFKNDFCLLGRAFIIGVW